MSDGIYRKYNISRTDGSSDPGGKHEHCTYFVLDLEHDPFAIPALKAYAQSCRETHPELARDLRRIVAQEAAPSGSRFVPDGPSGMAWWLMYGATLQGGGSNE